MASISTLAEAHGNRYGGFRRKAAERIIAEVVALGPELPMTNGTLNYAHNWQVVPNAYGTAKNPERSASIAAAIKRHDARGERLSRRGEREWSRTYRNWLESTAGK